MRTLKHERPSFFNSLCLLQYSLHLFSADESSLFFLNFCFARKGVSERVIFSFLSVNGVCLSECFSFSEFQK